ncbi:lignostilbene-alpha,beta-dioxygenase isozyme III [Aaosphaeria arxii CBS 175.79]|uniref:Lignostilbene-alpha,beta-dioxygenase isozyme III n=1 Tax=Aaosphaeria arxii CBS 175.79 TaxID=1450172 RepID=A0A6A5XT57_9PLEO|nr:lignostilbene-alpha,beta-dioxygenase isozyme III [Aaosphaeria arxii CBS 175.79]KAF2016392.1 lignostilbene-alpha,beta-dioxygenase isozyme III [Aaosphaeria arxii CBS 175.79]
MAHIFALAEPARPAYHEGNRNGDQVKFPDTGFFQGFNKPSRLEADIFELETTGEIPKDINGTFYRIQPDHRFPPLFEEDIHFNGDGSVSAFRFENGHVDFRQRYVHTDRFKAETKARKALLGKYRNPYTDNEMVKGIIRTASNTNITFWRGVLLASKEDGPPFAMDPVTLETIGRYDFDGQVQSPTFTAHPKFDPDTGEMVCWGYEAGGDGHDASCDIVVYTIDKDGKKTEECWYKAPFCGMIHDGAITKNFLILPLTPIKADAERLKRGGNHFAWDPNEDQWYGIVPRRGGKPDDIIWLRADNGFHGHVAGSYEDEEGKIVVDLTVASDNVFFFFPPDNPTPTPTTLLQRNKLISDTYRWKFDPKAPTNTRVTPTLIYGINGEFSRVDDRYLTHKYNHFWQCQIDPTRPYDFPKCGPPAGGLFNVIGHFEWDSLSTSDGEKKEPVKDTWWAGPTTTFQEPVFVPKEGSNKEGEGYLIALLNHLDVLRNDILIFDALNISKGPLAAIHLPVKLRLGLHGNFIEQREIDEWAERRKEGGDIGPAKPAKEPLPWQKKFFEEHGLTGVKALEGHSTANGRVGVNGH